MSAEVGVLVIDGRPDVPFVQEAGGSEARHAGTKDHYIFH
jgi:hypothetical protein